ncbi:hypothetical protein BRC95_00455 [Halobacteriales archaeon QS_5_68_33]|nr:MAG: hypothetical protein BRC95_00455 [Halobacteriales archaeon QS_5_68_33]
MTGMDDRAVRNLVGFTLTFSIIVVSVGLTATLGTQQLDAVSQSERVENARAGSEQLANSLERLQQQRSVVATSELDLAEGTLTVTDGTTMTVRTTDNFNRTVSTGGLAYRIGDTTFDYEAGALFRTDARGNAVMLAPPTMSCTDERAVVSVVRVTPRSATQFGGREVTVTATAESQELLYPLNRTGRDSAGDAEEANVTVTSPRADAWAQHFEDAGNWTESATLEDTYVCDAVDAVYIRQTNVTIGFRG